MGYAVVAIIAVLSLLITLQRGAVTAFVWLYFPSLLLLDLSPQIPIPSFPDIGATHGVMYGIIFGLLIKGGEPMPFRWGWLDTLVILLVVSMIISYMATEKVWTGVAVAGEQFFEYIAPYFMARIMFHSAKARRQALWIIIAIAIFVGVCALIELRLFPLS